MSFEIMAKRAAVQFSHDELVRAHGRPYANAIRRWWGAHIDATIMSVYEKHNRWVDGGVYSLSVGG